MAILDILHFQGVRGIYMGLYNSRVLSTLKERDKGGAPNRFTYHRSLRISTLAHHPALATHYSTTLPSTHHPSSPYPSSATLVDQELAGSIGITIYHSSHQILRPKFEIAYHTTQLGIVMQLAVNLLGQPDQHRGYYRSQWRGKREGDLQMGRKRKGKF